MRRYCAEFIGTFVLVFAGTGAVVVNDISGGQIGHMGAALTMGGVVDLGALSPDCCVWRGEAG